MSNTNNKKNQQKPLPPAKPESDWLRNKLSAQKKVTQIRPISFHGTQHRG